MSVWVGEILLVILLMFVLFCSVIINSGNGMLATWGTIIGFVVMMCLDVGLG